MVSVVVSISGRLSLGTMNNSIAEFIILKNFLIDGHFYKAPKTKEAIWLSPPCYWTKCNVDGAAHGCPGNSACGSLFRDYNSAALGNFSCNLGCSTYLFAELSAVIYATKIANSKGWLKLWIKTDLMLVVRAFTNLEIVPWRLHSRWKNCMLIAKGFTLQVTHIYPEGNSYADKLANYGIHHPKFIWWDSIPFFY